MRCAWWCAPDWNRPWAAATAIGLNADFPMPAKRAIPPARKGTANRVQLSHKPRVDAATAKQLLAWQVSGVSLSVLLDRLTAHAKRTHFNPGVDCL